MLWKVALAIGAGMAAAMAIFASAFNSDNLGWQLQWLFLPVLLIVAIWDGSCNGYFCQCF